MNEKKPMCKTITLMNGQKETIHYAEATWDTCSCGQTKACK